MSASAPAPLYPSMKSYGVLFLAFHKTDGKVFIGRSVVSVESRWRQLVENALRDANPVDPLYKAIRADGADAFEISKLSEGGSQEDLDRMEIEAFTTFNSTKAASGYNQALYKPPPSKQRPKVQRREERKPPTQSRADLKLAAENWCRKMFSSEDLETLLDGSREAPTDFGQHNRNTLGKLTRHVAFVVTSLLQGPPYRGIEPPALIDLYCKVARQEALGMGLSRYTIASIANTAARLNGFEYTLVMKPRGGAKPIDPPLTGGL